jgi:hypothetical protein
LRYALEWWMKNSMVTCQNNTSANWAGYADGQDLTAFQEGIYAVFNSGFWLCSDMYTSEVKLNAGMRRIR